MKTLIFHLIFFLCLSSACFAQDNKTFLAKLKNTTWVAGISGTVIDDDGKAFKDVFNAKNGWNFLYFPSKINLEGYFEKYLSFEGAFTYSLLKKGKLLGKENYPRPNNVNLYAFDANCKFYPIELIGESKFFSPYSIAGLGYTYRSLPERRNAITLNFGFGLSVWLYKGFGLNVQSMAKFALNNASSKNYLQHSLGAVYRFDLSGFHKTTKNKIRRAL